MCARACSAGSSGLQEANLLVPEAHPTSRGSNSGFEASNLRASSRSNCDSETPPNQKKKPSRKESLLTPQMKGFIDRVTVPILLEWYLSDLQKQKQIAENVKGMASCELMTNSPVNEVAR